MIGGAVIGDIFRVRMKTFMPGAEGMPWGAFDGASRRLCRNSIFTILRESRPYEATPPRKKENGGTV